MPSSRSAIIPSFHFNLYNCQPPKPALAIGKHQRRFGIFLEKKEEKSMHDCSELGHLLCFLLEHELYGCLMKSIE